MKFYIIIFMAIQILAVTGCSKQSKDVKNEIKSCIVTFKEGEAYLADSTDKIINIGDSLKENDTVKTGLKSTVELQFKEKSIIRVKENSILKISSLYNTENSGKVSLFLDNGKILANPEKQAKNSVFEIETQSITVGVRGTEFVVISQNNISKVAVRTGEVSLKRKLDIKALEKIKNDNPELAKKIDDKINSSIIIKSGEKIEITDNEINKIVLSVSPQIEKISSLSNIQSADEVQLLNAIPDTTVINKIESVTDDDWKNTFDMEELENINKSKDTSSDTKYQSDTDNGKVEQHWVQKNKIFDKAIELARSGNKEESIKTGLEEFQKIKDKYGEDHPYTIDAMFWVSSVYSWNQEYDKAIDNAKKIRSFFEKSSGYKYVGICYSVTTIAFNLFMQNKLDESEKAYNEVSGLLKKVKENGIENDSEINKVKAEISAGLADIYEKKGQLPEAINFYNEYISLIDKSNDVDNFSYIYKLLNFREILIKANKSGQVKSIDKRIGKIAEQNPELTTIISQFKTNKKWDEYNRLFEKARNENINGNKKAALKIAENNVNKAQNEFGDDNPITEQSKFEIANLYLWSDPPESEKSEILIKNFINFKEKNGIYDDTSICWAYNNYGYLMLRKNKNDEAIKYFETALKFSRNLINKHNNFYPQFPQILGESLKGIAVAYKNQKQFVKTEKYLNEAVKEMEKYNLVNTQNMLGILYEFKSFYDERQRPEKSKEIDERIKALNVKN
jgi:tetratricopeptide (TPR) repeat protein